MNRILSILICLAAVIGIVALASAGDRPNATTDVLVRVAIVRDAREIDLEVNGPFKLAEGKNSREFSSSTRLALTKVRLLDKGFFISGDVYSYQRLVITPLMDADIKVNQHSFRGQVILIRTPEGRITVVNTINIEDYIKGVLYHEVSHHWPMETIKAQAVATRTYALYSIAKNKDYDVTNDIYSQVYGGRGSERYRTGLAVERTASQILVFDGIYFYRLMGEIDGISVTFTHLAVIGPKKTRCLSHNGLTISENFFFV